MNKFLLSLAGTLALLNTNAQCLVTTIPNSDNGNGVCYINGLTVDASVINSATGYTASPPSYQSFNSPYIILKQDMMSTLSIDFVSGIPADVCAWIDYDQDGIYSSTEIAFYAPGLSGPNVTLSTTPSITVAPDTFRMRIGLQQGVPGWGPGTDDACITPGYGEVEDYLVILQCADPQPLMFDPFPIMCWQDSVSLFASGMYDVAWYAGTPPVMIGQGFGYNLHLNPGCTDTIVYVQSTTAGCFSNPLEQISIIFDPSPVANIIGPDTIRSCSTVTVNATPGPYSYFWNAGGSDSSITFTSGFGGDLILTTTSPNGCSSEDRIYVNIATAPPSTYAHVIAGSSFCSNLEVMLMYDSIIAPGTCTWYTYPANTLIGSGQAFYYNLPDTGVYQFQGIINSTCGADTALITVNGYTGFEYDSTYVLNATLGPNGVYTFCYDASGFITGIISGLQGSVSYWYLTDETINFSSVYYDDDTLQMSSNLVQSGHLYSAQAYVLNAMGCIDTTRKFYLTPANTLNFSMPDSSWGCNFPVLLGNSNANYATYDFLWSTGDTTNTITVPSPMNITLYAIDHASGCITNDTTYVGDASQMANLFGDTTYVCNGNPYFDPQLVQYTADYWEEFDMGWNQISSMSSPDYYMINSNDGYIIFHGYNTHGCYIHDTTFVTYSGNYTFSLGTDITTTSSPVTLTGPNGNGMYYYTWGPVLSNNQSIQVNTSGTYYLTVINQFGCSYTDTIVVNILPTGLHGAQSQSVNVFPNPANDRVTVQSASMIIAVTIYDLNGRLISSQACNSTVEEINISSVPAGCYFIETYTQEGVSRSRLVKQE